MKSWIDPWRPSWQDPETLNQRLTSYSQKLQDEVSEFLDVAGEEARACFARMFDEIGKSPLLGLSALGGLVGMSAYVKAIAELRCAGIDDADLLSVGDVADLAARMAVPFVLLVAGFAMLVFAWTASLLLDHRKTLSFVIVMGVSVAALLIPFKWFSWYVGGDPGTMIGLCFVTLGLLSAAPAVRLVVAGLKRPGVKTDDRVQQSVLKVLRFVADPRSLLLAFVTVCVALIYSPMISVLMDVDKPVYASAREPTKGGLDVRVLEDNKMGAPILISSIARLSRGWVVRRFKPTENESPMLVVATTDVACVREPTSKERVNAASGKLIPLSNQCTAKAVTLNHDTLSSNGDVGNWGSVDDYATRELGCDSKTFAKDSKPVRAYYFSFGVPRADYDAVSFSDKNVVSIPALEFTKLGLPPFRGAQANPNSDLPGLLNELGDDKGGKIWVLGFASIAGDPSKNFDLSARRARALRQLLVRAGKAMPLSQAIAERIEFRGLGATFLAGMASPNDLASERVAVAFLCHFSGEPNTPSVEESP